MYFPSYLALKPSMRKRFGFLLFWVTKKYRKIFFTMPSEKNISLEKEIEESELLLASIDLAVKIQLDDIERYLKNAKGKTRSATSEQQAFLLQKRELQKTAQILPALKFDPQFAARWKTEKTQKAKLEREPVIIPTHECVACREICPQSHMVQAPCQHIYCQSCIEGLFKASFADESLFPPHCCTQNLDPGHLSLIKGGDVPNVAKLQKLYRKKKIEFETVDRTYCHSPSCGIFIEHTKKYDAVRCPDCRMKTCVHCKKLAHTGECPDDSALSKLLVTAKKRGWQRCYKCRSVVQLETGCNQITCRCRAQFCYLCGEKWKRCDCPKWTERYLLASRERIY